MTDYRRSILFIVLIFGMMLWGGCRKKSYRNNGPHLTYADTALMDVMLVIKCNELQGSTTKLSAVDENSIKTLNLFFVHQKYKPLPGGKSEIRHYYFETFAYDKGQIQLKLANIRLGEYRVYAIANAKTTCTIDHNHGSDTNPFGKMCCFNHALTLPDGLRGDICEITETEIQGLVSLFDMDIINQPTGLLMSNFRSDDESGENRIAGELMTIQQSDKPSDHPTGTSRITVNLTRRVARYEFSYSYIGELATKSSEMDVSSISVKYLPKKVSLFDDNDNEQLSEADDFLNEKKLVLKPKDAYNDDKNPDGSYNNVVSFYLPENKQGVATKPDNTVFTSQDRNVVHAPKLSSYIFLSGKYTGMMGEVSLDASLYNGSLYLGDGGYLDDAMEEDMKGGDFNVMGNGDYRVHLELGGPDPDDVRVSLLNLEMEEFDPNSPSPNVKTSAIITITYTNFLNDILSLECGPFGDKGDYTIEVYNLGENGVEGDKVENINEDSEKFEGILVTTGQKPISVTKRFKIYYSQSEESTHVSLITYIKTLRHGQSKMVSRDISVKDGNKSEYDEEMLDLGR